MSSTPPRSRPEWPERVLMLWSAQRSRRGKAGRGVEGRGYLVEGRGYLVEGRGYLGEGEWNGGVVRAGLVRSTQCTGWNEGGQKTALRGIYLPF